MHGHGPTRKSIPGRRRFLRDRPVIQEVLVIPQSFDAAEYSRARQVVFVHAEPGSAGHRFIDIDVRPQVRNFGIGPGTVLRAFFIDALTYPYQLYVWIVYARASKRAFLVIELVGDQMAAFIQTGHSKSAPGPNSRGR